MMQFIFQHQNRQHRAGQSHGEAPTGKSMAEMNIDLNLQFESSRILENDKALQPITAQAALPL